MEKNNNLKLNLEVETAVIKSNVKDIRKSIDRIEKSLNDHINSENEAIESIREYIDSKGNEYARSWVEKAVYGLFGFIGVVLISTIGYLWPAKMNDEGHIVETEQTE